MVDDGHGAHAREGEEEHAVHRVTYTFTYPSTTSTTTSDSQTFSQSLSIDVRASAPTSHPFLGARWSPS